MKFVEDLVFRIWYFCLKIWKLMCKVRFWISPSLCSPPAESALQLPGGLQFDGVCLLHLFVAALLQNANSVYDVVTGTATCHVLIRFCYFLSLLKNCTCVCKCVHMPLMPRLSHSCCAHMHMDGRLCYIVSIQFFSLLLSFWWGTWESMSNAFFIICLSGYMKMKSKFTFSCIN